MFVFISKFKFLEVFSKKLFSPKNWDTKIKDPTRGTKKLYLFLEALFSFLINETIVSQKSDCNIKFKITFAPMYTLKDSPTLSTPFIFPKHLIVDKLSKLYSILEYEMFSI